MLIVEDSPDDAMLIRRALDTARVANPTIECDTAEASRQAVQRHDDLPVLCIIDVHLRGPESGLDWLQWLRSPAARGADVPAIVLTGSHDPAHRATSEALGTLCYITKPVTAGGLLDAVRHLGLIVVSDQMTGETQWRIISARGRIAARPADCAR